MPTQVMFAHFYVDGTRCATKKAECIFLPAVGEKVTFYRRSRQPAWVDCVVERREYRIDAEGHDECLVHLKVVEEASHPDTRCPVEMIEGENEE